MDSSAGRKRVRTIVRLNARQLRTPTEVFNKYGDQDIGLDLCNGCT
jgi:hypothetical protein